MNFCTEALGTKIEIINDRVAEEFYEVTNLLKRISPATSYFGAVGNGISGTDFMAARFIRPPITIRIDFPIPIHISHIVINPKVGQQISTGFKIQVDINSSASRRRQPEAEPSLYQIAREFLQGPPFPETVVFRNPRFILHQKYCGLPLAEFETHRNFPNSFGLRHPTNNSCERVFSLYLTIERASAPASIPVLGSLQIWGQPSRWLSPHQVHTIIVPWLGSLEIVKRSGSVALSEPNDKEEGLDNEEPSKKRLKMSSPESSSSIPVSIPEEFLDPITFEILCQPVRLPCGTAIDSKTLEKYSREEAKWGRLENDPFTGLIFTETSRPVSDFSLKARIDSFLTKNANEIRVPRTLGMEDKESPHGTPRFHSSRITTASSSSLPVPAPSSFFSSPPPQPQAKNSSNTESMTGKDSIRSTEMRSKDFMAQELARIINSGPSFKPPPLEVAHPLSSSDAPECFQCFRRFSHRSYPSVFFYQSGCNHTFVCRTCLVGLNKGNTFTCRACSADWSPKDLTRIFV